MLKSSRSITAVITAAFLMLITGCGLNDEDDALKRIRKRGEIKIAVSSGYAPFSFYNSRRELTGFDIDIAAAIASRLGVKVSFIDVPWQGIIAGLQAGNYDAVVSSMAITEERAVHVGFSEPYYYSRAQLFVKQDSRLKKIQDLKDKIIGCTEGTTYVEDARRLNPRQVILYPSHEEGLQQLMNGRINAVITDEILGMQAVKYRRLPLEPVGGPLRSEKIAVAVRKEDQRLLQAVNDIIKTMRANGDLRQMIEKMAKDQYR